MTNHKVSPGDLLLTQNAKYTYMPHIKHLIDVSEAAQRLAESAHPITTGEHGGTFSVDAEALHKLRAALLVALVNAPTK